MEPAGHVAVLAALVLLGIRLVRKDAVLPFHECRLLEAVRERLEFRDGLGLVQVRELAVLGVDVGQVDGVASAAEPRVLEVGAELRGDAQRRLHRQDGHLFERAVEDVIRPLVKASGRVFHQKVFEVAAARRLHLGRVGRVDVVADGAAHAIAGEVAVLVILIILLLEAFGIEGGREIEVFELEVGVEPLGARV